MVCRSTPNLVFWTVAQTGRVTPIATSLPGAAKSRCVEAFGRAVSRKTYILIGSLRTPEDIGGFPYPSGDGETRYMAVMPPKWAHDCHAGNWNVFFDELNRSAPPVQSSMLGVIAENRVGDSTLPDRTWKTAACNPPGCGPDCNELDPALANRLCHLIWQSPVEAWRMGMLNDLCFPEPEFTLLPSDWERHIGRNSGLVTAFTDARPDLREAFPKDRAKQCGPWPSLRSWTNAAVCAAALEAIDAEPLLRYQAIAGCVGEEATLEFQDWESKLDLPSPEDWIAKAIHARAVGAPLVLDIPPRSDQVMAVLGALTDRVKNYQLAGDGKPTERRWLAAVDCYAAVAKTWVELAVSAGAPLYACVPDASVLLKAPMEFSNHVLEIHRNLMAA